MLTHKFAFIYISLIMTLASTSYASNNTRFSCEGVFTSTSSFMDTTLKAGSRGFMGPGPEYNIENIKKSFLSGMTYWAQPVATASTIEAAIENHNSIEKEVHRPVYIITNDVISNEMTRDQIHNLVQSNSEKPWIWIQNGQVIVLSDFQKKQLFINNGDTKIIKKSSGVVINFNGWTLPWHAGLFEYKNMNSKVHKTTRALARKLFRQGYKITNNQRFEDDLVILGSQVRRGKDPSTNRYTPEYIKTMREFHEQGLVGSIEVVDPEGQIVGGLIYFKSGPLVNADTILYPGGLDFAKVAVVALVDTLHSQGVDYFYTEMLSDFSISLKGELHPMNRLHSLINESLSKGIHEVSLDTSEWQALNPNDENHPDNIAAKSEKHGDNHKINLEKH